MAKSNNFLVLNKLEKVHAYVKQLIVDEILPSDKRQLEYYFSDIKFNGLDADMIYQYMSDLFIGTIKPKVVSKKIYENTNSAEYFRCSKNYDLIANLLSQENAHYGWGTNSNGIYCSNSYDYAVKYFPNIDENPEKIDPSYLKFKLNTNKIISKEDLFNEFVSLSNGEHSQDEFLHNSEIELAMFLAKIENDDIFDSNLFVNMFENDAGKLGLILGFDAIDMNGDGKSIAILNPNKIVVESSEFDRVCEKSDSYRDYSSQNQARNLGND